MKIYYAALQAARYEGTLLWQIFSVFLIIHTAIVGFVIQGIDQNMGACKDFRVFVASIGGILLCLLWAATYLRNSSHYRFYLARAREHEPADWHLYGGSGKDFSHGKEVNVGAHKYRLTSPARWVKSGRMIPPVICVFFSAYILGLLTSSIGCFPHRTQATSQNVVGTNIVAAASQNGPKPNGTQNMHP